MWTKLSPVHLLSPDYIKLHDNKKNHHNLRKSAALPAGMSTHCVQALMQVPVITTQLIKLLNLIENWQSWT